MAFSDVLTGDFPGAAVDKLARKYWRGTDFEVDPGDEDVYNLLVELHRASVLSLNGYTCMVTFPFPHGRAAFEDAIQVCNHFNHRTRV